MYSLLRRWAAWLFDLRFPIPVYEYRTTYVESEDLLANPVYTPEDIINIMGLEDVTEGSRMYEYARQVADGVNENEGIRKVCLLPRQCETELVQISDCGTDPKVCVRNRWDLEDGTSFRDFYLLRSCGRHAHLTAE